MPADECPFVEFRRTNGYPTHLDNGVLTTKSALKRQTQGTAVASLQVGETEPFICELLTNLTGIIQVITVRHLTPNHPSSSCRMNGSHYRILQTTQSVFLNLKLLCIIQDLETHQIHMFYETVGLMISAETVPEKRDEYVVRALRRSL